MSKLFIDVFNDRSGGVLRTCACGITWFDEASPECFESGELERLQELAKEKPDKYKTTDYSIGLLEIGGQQIVIDCVCDKAEKYEKFIVLNAEKIAEYLRGRSKLLIQKAEALKI